MPQRSIIVGVILVALGIVATFASSSESFTSLIPSILGALFIVLGLVARAKPDLSHHMMHGVAGISALAILGSLGSLVGRGSTGWALFAQVATVVLCGALLYFAIDSFRQARRARTS